MNKIKNIIFILGWNRNFIFKNKVMEIFPIAVIGISFGSINLKEKLKRYRLKIIFLCFLNIFLLFKYHFIKNIEGFYFPGFKPCIGGIFLFIFFLLIPIEFIKSKYVFLIIKIISNYTGGIYYYHTIIRNYLRIHCFSITKHFYAIIIIYIINYLLCFIGIKIFGKTKLKYLFF